MIEYGPAVRTLVDAQLARNEKHATFLRRRFEGLSPAEMENCETFAEQILLLTGDRLDDLVEGYEFICRIQKEEELYFRRHKQYRLKTFQEAYDQVYNNEPYMDAYVRGILMSQLFWSNHTRSMTFYTDVFLKGLAQGSRLLEIGPGHGLLLVRAIKQLGPGAVTAWDVSPASLKLTQEALRALGVTEGFTLKEHNLFEAEEAPDEQFDAVVFSEVLEHVDEPARALRSIRAVTKPGGKVFINAAVNSPIPDHIFLMRSPDEATKVVEDQGFEILAVENFPATNYTLEQALKHDLTISTCIIATPA